MQGKAQGFTLIELMIVVAIIAILAAIALPAYNKYRIRSAEGACQAEAKAYMDMATAAGQSQMAINDPMHKACSSPTTAILSSDISSSSIITFTPVAPGSAPTTCDASSATCSMIPSV